MQRAGGRKISSAAGILRVESVPFSLIPGQSDLFVKYQSDPLSLKKYYPSAVASHSDITFRIPEVLENYTTDRKKLCDALVDYNRAIGASPETLANIELLRRVRTVAVVTGQQAGLFTGPLYTIYKALSAIKMAECLNERAFDAVPVFWAATEDHDFEEVSKAAVLDASDRLAHITAKQQDGAADQPVGNAAFDRSTIEALFAALPPTGYSEELRQLLSEASSEGIGFGTAFTALLARLLGKFGLVMIDPLSQPIKELAAPLYRKAAEKSEEIVKAVRERNKELEADSFHAQVLVEDDYFPLFWHNDAGQRKALRRSNEGTYRAAGEKRAFEIVELADLAGREPERFSPGVMLRPVVQDFLLPTVCYFGGGAEIAYFAQNSEVYRLLQRPVTPILHRQSFTVVEARHSRTLAKYGLQFEDILSGPKGLIPRIVEEFLSPQTAMLFADVEERINTELHRLDAELSHLDPTLAINLATRRRKIIYHIAALRKKWQRSRIERDGIVNRQLNSAFASLLPEGHLQERTLNIASFLDRHGPYFVDWIYGSIDLGDSGHRVVYLEQ